MNAINYQRVLERTLAGLQGTPKLLLHSCCAPCSSYVLEYLSPFFEITVLYYNPNISPRGEYEARLAEQKRLIAEQPHVHPVHILEGNYCPEDYFAAVRGLEEMPEGGARCQICFEMRLREAARVAKAIGADWLTTTLTVGSKKDARLLNELGTKIEAETGVPYLHSDFKKHDGYNRSIELSRQYDLYRQNYCGCIFSQMARSDQ